MSWAVLIRVRWDIVALPATASPARRRCLPPRDGRPLQHLERSQLEQPVGPAAPSGLPVSAVTAVTAVTAGSWEAPGDKGGVGGGPNGSDGGAGGVIGGMGGIGGSGQVPGSTVTAAMVGLAVSSAGRRPTPVAPPVPAVNGGDSGLGSLINGPAVLCP